MDKVGLRTASPFFIVDDLVKSAEYYRDVLGFKFDRYWDEPPSFVMVRRGSVEIMLKMFPTKGLVRPNHKVDPEGASWDTYIRVKDVDAFYKELKTRGAKVKSEPCDQFYDMREIEVQDCNGYILCFGQDINIPKKAAKKKTVRKKK